MCTNQVIKVWASYTKIFFYALDKEINKEVSNGHSIKKLSLKINTIL